MEKPTVEEFTKEEWDSICLSIGDRIQIMKKINNFAEAEGYGEYCFHTREKIDYYFKLLKKCEAKKKSG